MFRDRLNRSLALIGLIGLGICDARAQTNTLPSDTVLIDEPPPIANAPPTSAPPATSPAPTSPSERPDYWPISISGEAGTMGAGGVVSLRFLDHLGVRGGGDYLAFDYTQTFEDIRYVGRVRLQSEHAALDFYPAKKSSFRISVGAIFNQNQFTGSPDQDITVGGITFTPAEYGQIDLRIKQQPVNPYIALGGNFWHFGRRAHWALGGEIGVLYSKWDVSLTQTGGIAPPPPALINDQKQKINDNLNRYPVWPIVKLQLTCSF